MSRSSRARIRTLLFKEWHEMRRNRILMATAIGLPLCLLGTSAMMVLMMIGADEVPEEPGDLEEMSVLLGDRVHQFDSVADAMGVWMGEMGLLILLLTPAILPSMLAATTIVREKQSRSLESLLTTPVRTWELVLSKLAFSVVIGVVPTYVCVALYYVVAAYALSDVALSMLAAPGWLIAVLVLGPQLGLLAGGVAIAISSRIKDMQTAQQLTGLISLPVLAAMGVLCTGVATLSTGAALMTAGVFLLLDLLAVAMSISLFERETILIRWK